MIYLLNIYILIGLIIWGVLGTIGIMAFIINMIIKKFKNAK